MIYLTCVLPYEKNIYKKFLTSPECRLFEACGEIETIFVKFFREIVTRMFFLTITPNPSSPILHLPIFCPFFTPLLSFIIYYVFIKAVFIKAVPSISSGLSSTSTEGKLILQCSPHNYNITVSLISPLTISFSSHNFAPIPSLSSFPPAWCCASSSHFDYRL